jgi:hypothetical protein
MLFMLVIHGDDAQACLICNMARASSQVRQRKKTRRMAGL